MIKNSFKKIYADQTRTLITTLTLVVSIYVDVITTFSKGLPISFGTAFRGLILVYMIFYLLFIGKDKWIRWMMVTTLLYICAHLAQSYFYDGTSYLVSDFSEIAKSFYFPIMCLWTYDLVKTTDFKIKSSDFVFVFISLVLIFVLSILTQTDLKSYAWMNGSSGWFYSSNEVSSIVAAIIPIFTISLFKSKNTTSRILWGVAVVLMSVIIGTRTTFYATTLWILFLIFFWVRSYLKHPEKTKKANLVLSAFMLVFLAVVYPFSPASQNQLGSSEVGLHSNNGSVVSSDHTSIPLPDYTQTPLFHFQNGASTFINGLLKNRLQFLIDNYAFFEAANPSEKVLGLGSMVTINGKVRQLQVEMDPFTILFRYGIFGLVLMLLPFVVYVIYELSSLGRNHRLIQSLEYLSFGYALVILTGLSVVAGHVIIAPSVSMFLVFIMAGLTLLRKKILSPIKDDQKIIFISSTGGHLNQLMQMKPLFGTHQSLIITEESPINERMKAQFPLEFLKYGTRKQKNYIVIFLWNTVKSFALFIKFRPDIIITTGTHTAVPVALIAKCFGRKLIYIESFAKRNSANLAGKILRPFADQIVVQWESMLEVYPEAENWGWIF